MSASANAYHGRRLARLAAVQGLYACSVGHISRDDLLDKHRLYWQSHEMDGLSFENMDQDFFRSLAGGVYDHSSDLNTHIAAHLAPGWKMDRLELVVAHILRCALWELQELDDVPTRTILNEYLEIAHGFCSPQNVSFINGLLDQIAREMRKLDDNNKSEPAPKDHPASSRNHERA